MAGDPSARRLWVQWAPPAHAAPPADAGNESLSAAVFAASLVSSGIGALVKTAADRLGADAEFSIASVLACEPAFRLAANATKPEYRLTWLILNVGRRKLDFTRTGDTVSFDRKALDYTGSPVVIVVRFHRSADGTAIAGQVVNWKYAECLNAVSALRDDQRKITVEIKVADCNGTALLATAMQVTAPKGRIGRVVPGNGELLPWSKMPALPAPAERPAGRVFDYGPVNVQVRITEVAAPSWFGRLLASTLSSQEAAIETYVKDRVTRSLDASAAAQARIVSIGAAQTAWTQYAEAHKDAKAAKGTLDKDNSAANQQLLAAKRALVHAREDLTREAHAAAGLAFQSLGEI